MVYIPSVAALDRKIIEKASSGGRSGGLYEFLRRGWSEADSSPFVGGWHLQAICAHLEAVSKGEIDRLIINIPPGMSKSLTTCVFWPTWDWTLPTQGKTLGPQDRFMFASFDATLSNRDSGRAKQLIKSHWFQERWPEVTVVHGGVKANTAGVWYCGDKDGKPTGGLRFSTSVGAKATGWHAHKQVCDDPIKPKDIQDGGDLARGACERAWDWWGTTMSTRKADPKNFARVIIMQRLHHEDIAGRCIQAMEDGSGEEHVVLSLPMRFVSNLKCVTPIFEDPRTVDGELLCPARFDEKAVRTTELELGHSRAVAAQLQQTPTAESGDIFHRDWFLQEWRAIPAEARWIISVDCAFKESSTSDYVVMMVMAMKGSQVFIVDRIKERLSLPSTIQALKTLSSHWPQARLKLIEDKANGPAVEQSLRHELPGIVMAEPMGSKEARANAASVFWQAGNVFLPESHRCAWKEDFIREHTTFPMGTNDDQVDAASQGILYFMDSTLIKLKKAMENQKKTRKSA